MARSPATNPADLGGDDQANETTIQSASTNPADLGGDEVGVVTPDEALIACVSTGAFGVVPGTIVHVSPRNLAESVARGFVYEPVAPQDADASQTSDA
jgi:hypothetical protein